MMHDDAPKMSVAQGLVASTSQPKSVIVTDVPPVEYDMNTAEQKPNDNIDLDLKIAYVDPAATTAVAGEYIPIGSKYASHKLIR